MPSGTEDADVLSRVQISALLLTGESLELRGTLEEERMFLQVVPVNGQYSRTTAGWRHSQQISGFGRKALDL